MPDTAAAPPPTSQFVRDKNGFYWTDREVMHHTRQSIIFQKHGDEIRKLMGIEPLTKYLVGSLVTFQIVCALFAARWFPTWGPYLAFTYVVGGTLNHMFFLAIHEITHNLCFKTPIYNDYLAIYTNLPIGVPYAMLFKHYHADHHRYLGWDGVDTDVATETEAKLLNSWSGKAFFLTFQALFYAARPMFVRKPKVTRMVLLNWAAQLSFLAFAFWCQGISPIFYCLLSSFFGCAPSPLAGHFIAEHFVLDEEAFRRGQDTASYYGPLNWITWNVGYHIEHHDFPNIPWTRLPALKRIAREYYDPLYQVPSWTQVLVQFMCMSPLRVSSRLKREQGAWKRDKLLPTKVLYPVDD